MRSNPSSQAVSATTASTSETTTKIAAAARGSTARHHIKTRSATAQPKSWPQRLLIRLMSLLLIASLATTSFAATANARFISPDDWDPTKPGVGTNRYAYAGNDPVNKADANGHLIGIDDAIVGAITLGIAVVSSWFSSSSPANAPGPNDKIQTKSESEVARDMAIGACVAVCGSEGIKSGLSFFSKTKDENKKEIVSTEERITKADAGVSTGKNYSEVFKSNGDEYSVSGVKEINGNNVTINEIDINKIGNSPTNPAATADIKSQMARSFAKDFDSLTINGVRISGANPDRTISVTIDLRPYK